VAAARLIQVANALTAAGLETVGGHEAAFMADLTSARPHAEACAAADRVRRWLAGADQRLLGRVGVHDPYAWRCVPQVHGAAMAACEWATRACLTELGSCTDNPVVTDDGRILSGGNFHAAPLGIPMDALRLGIGEVAALSRQRIARLARHLTADDRLSGHPAEATGLTMVLTAATAALLEIGSLGPATGHWLPVDDVEDHTSNATVAALLTLAAVDQAWTVLAAEAISVAVHLQRAARPRPAAGPASSAARWLSGLRPGLAGPGEVIRLDRPLAATLERLRGVLPGAACEPPPGPGGPRGSDR
jgi:histidine ammonia-lyase